MTSFSNIRPMWIIHLFALLHAVVALTCRLAGIEDELLLTLLTMTMVLLVCFRKNLNIEFTASIIIISNILGYLFGTLGASILETFISSPYAVHAVSTAVTTEILGWCVVGVSELFPKMKSGNGIPASTLKWTLLAAGGIFILRLAIMSIYSQQPLGAEKVFELTIQVLSNPVGIIVLICVNLLYIRNIINRHKDTSRLLRIASGCAFMLACSLLETLLAGSGFPFKMHLDFMQDFVLLFLVSILTQTTVYCMVFVVNYAISAKVEMHHEREKANMAQYRYLKLKGQVNPHFLFNSLNILDCLVCEGKSKEASTYIHKLAGIYRYMIKSEDEDIVPLRDELAFVAQYVDLLRLRFPEGFDVEINIPDKEMTRYVLPCSVQLIIENATKHNAVTSDNPLKISIEVIDDKLKVCNNIIPKVTRVESTGLGHKYIRQQYMDLSGKTIEIENDGKSYSVTLPLL